MSYQERDKDIVDYQLFHLEGVGPALRGPRPETLEVGRYFTCIGAAQTFGALSVRPYPHLLAERIGLAPLNLGAAGAGPRLFLEEAGMLKLSNASAFVVVQVMSGRSEDNSLYASHGRELLQRRSDGETVAAETAYRELLEQGSSSEVMALVNETRANWVANMRRLLALIDVPTILLWFSKRAPDYTPDLRGVHRLFGEFPQLVDRYMVEQIRYDADEYVECVTDRGSPHALINRHTGKPTGYPGRTDLGKTVERSLNSYYPSPEMHEDAAKALEAPAGRLSQRHDISVSP
jgi:hypothetical protein